ncbi:MAG: substrate-binding domain-containing protein, partial [Chloroflexota bacterium]
FKTVEIDNFWGAQLAVSHLLEKGYKNIGIITGPLNELAANERFLGWRYSLQEASQDADQSLIAHGSWNPDSGYRAAQLLLEQNPNLDAIFSSNDEMAIGAMRAIMEAGYKIPQDYGIVGFDDILTSRFLTPSLTTIRQDINASSQIAVQELIQLIENDVNQNHQPEQVITLPPELIIRESTRRK